MKRVCVLIAMAFTLILPSLSSAFESGSTGIDGAFNPVLNTVLDVPSNGIFNFTTVNIPTGVTVSFKKNAANTPVYILANGDVTVSGTLVVNGTDGNIIFSGKGGPGGFDGGLGGTGTIDGGTGLGSGGGGGGHYNNANPYYKYAPGGGGGFGTNGGIGEQPSAGTGGGVYGNDKVLPLIGGSGGGGASGGAGSYQNYGLIGGGGGGGGGAILIASNGVITINGSISANGGNGLNGGAPNGSSGGGSGGAIKFMANKIAGNGTIQAIGGAGGIGAAGGSSMNGGTGGLGRIRFEAVEVVRATGTSPAYTYGNPSTVFVNNVPKLTITSVGGVTVPENPSGVYGSLDITLPGTTTNPVSIAVSASNIPVGTQITATSVPEYGSASTGTATLSGTDASSTATTQVTLSTQYQCILTAQATFTLQTAMFYEGEKVEKVKVATSMGKGQEVVYITESGKEISAQQMLASVMK